MSPIPDHAAYDANEKGQLTQAQAIGLLPLILLGAVFFLMGVVAFGGIVISALITNTVKGNVLTAVISGGVVSLIFFIFAYLIGGPTLIDLVKGKVQQVDGQAIRATERRYSRGGGASLVYYYAVDEQQFRVWSRKTYKALPEFVMVRAYYTPLSKSLVNIKHIYTKSA